MEFEGKAFMAYRSVDNVMYWYENESYYVCTLPQNYTNFEICQYEYVMLFQCRISGICKDVDSIFISDFQMKRPFLSP